MAWVALQASASVPTGRVVAVDVDDLELVLWRDRSGRPVVMDARCPHQWSHLEAEGVIDGDEIVCAAHFWRFDATGCGSKLNVLGRRDLKADIAVYPGREHEGVIEAMLVDDLVADPAAASMKETDDER